MREVLCEEVLGQPTHVPAKWQNLLAFSERLTGNYCTACQDEGPSVGTKKDDGDKKPTNRMAGKNPVWFSGQQGISNECKINLFLVLFSSSAHPPCFCELNLSSFVTVIPCQWRSRKGSLLKCFWANYIEV